MRQWQPSELTAVSCNADGPDSWLAEAVLQYGGRLEVVVPAREYRADTPTGTTPSMTRCSSGPPTYTKPA
ncbi:hypothetical protein GCM10010211_83490 [Streptomyces albospinus]|uniref:Uncharacterized protein n=1 Tax=Streptomyces albospinus TaxID=285515 RepID=A0ABQ2VPB3_9ACTN|nr:hypothetical protein GCM10010211_83490 [Streptomyces albospinus]